jgi:type I restriction enzyme R subunit
MLAKETLLDLIRHFIVFEKSKTVGASLFGCPEKMGVVTIETVKKTAGAC